MNKRDQVNAVALNLQRVMSAISAAFDALVGRGQHNIILVVGAGDVAQYASNVPRDAGVATLQDLLARWKVGLPDTLPGETTPADIRPFEYLLNAMEASARAADPAAANYAANRAEVLAYVGELLAKSRRTAA